MRQLILFVICAFGLSVESWGASQGQIENMAFITTASLKGKSSIELFRAMDKSKECREGPEQATYDICEVVLSWTAGVDTISDPNLTTLKCTQLIDRKTRNEKEEPICTLMSRSTLTKSNARQP